MAEENKWNAKKQQIEKKKIKYIINAIMKERNCNRKIINSNRTVGMNKRYEI